LKRSRGKAIKGEPQSWLLCDEEEGEREGGRGSSKLRGKSCVDDTLCNNNFNRRRALPKQLEVK